MRYPRDRSPNEREVLVMAVQTAIGEIDRNEESTTELKVAAFLCAAWPTLESQNQ
jgi:hypothetical protein